MDIKSSKGKVSFQAKGAGLENVDLQQLAEELAKFLLQKRNQTRE